MQPVWNQPALTFDAPTENGPARVLVAGELHLGLESELARQGAFLRSRSHELADRLLQIAQEQHATRLVLLGDIKHRVTHLSSQERRDVPAFFRRMDAFERVDIALGNHDAGLEALLPPAKFPHVHVHGPGGFVYDAPTPRVACLHGHAWPRPALLAADVFLVGHTHAAAALVDEHGRRTTEWAWIRGHLDPDAVHARYGRRSRARVIVFPPFNPLCGGTPVNQDGLLGPFARLLRLADAEFHLLDGRPLGRLAAAVTES